MSAPPPGNGAERDRERPRRPAIVPFPEDRLPPQNLEAEQGVLGSILLDNDVLHDVVPILKVEDFYRDTPPDHLPGDPRPLRPGQGDRRRSPWPTS